MSPAQGWTNLTALGFTGGDYRVSSDKNKLQFNTHGRKQL
jgi:hypothetical protein